MRFFFVASNLPEAGHTVRAPTVVVREALDALRSLGHDVVFQPLLPHDRDRRLTPSEERSLEWARARGIDVREPLQATAASPPGRRRMLREAVAAVPELFNPSYSLRDEVAHRVRADGADVVFHLWSAPALAACSAADAPVFAYYGNPDHKAIHARLRHPELFEIPHRTLRDRARIALTKLANRNRRRVNVRLMGTCRWAANVCAVDAAFFERQGHPDAFYIQNMWAGVAGGTPDRSATAAENKIVGNLGGLYGTGNTFGLLYLGQEVLPELERRIPGRFSIHLYGAGQMTTAVARAVAHPAVHVRGFVDDIDAEMKSAKIFLILNNNSPDFIVGHTRILHAWSLGVCLIAHRNMALAMPEIVHGENALLGASGEEIAEHVVAVLRDAELRHHIEEGGRRTFEQEFVPSVVMSRVVLRIERPPA